MGRWGLGPLIPLTWMASNRCLTLSTKKEAGIPVLFSIDSDRAFKGSDPSSEPFHWPSGKRYSTSAKADSLRRSLVRCLQFNAAA